MLPVFFEPLLRSLGHVINSDVTRIYRLSALLLQEAGTPPAAFDSGFVEPCVLRSVIGVPGSAIDQGHVDLVERGEARCFACLEGSSIAAYAWFAEGRVAARHNTGGPAFRGIGLLLAPHVAYLFKALVLPQYRGQGLMSSLIHAAASTLQNEGVDRIVTTTDIGNRAFQKSVEKIGFRHTGHAAELVLFGRHWFHLPGADQDVRFFRGDVS